MTTIVMIGPFPEDPAVIKGGVQASVHGLTLALSRCRDIGAIRVIAFPVRRRSVRATRVLGGITVTHLSAPLGFLASSAVHLPLVLRMIGQAEHPVVHVHGTGLMQTLLLAILRLRGVPLVWTLHGITEKETLQRYRENRTAGNLARHVLYRALERLSLRIAPDIAVDTPYVRAAVTTANRVHVLPQGVFAEELRAADLQARDPNLLLSIGVMSPRKGHLLTIDAFARVRERFPAARLVIAGNCAYPDHHRAIERRIRDLGLSACVTVRTDIGRADIVALLGRARVFLLHSREESQGIALCEALSAGLPVVATRVGGIPDVIADGQDGFLVDYGDVAGFADATIALLADDALHARLSRHARMASARFDWGNIAAAMSDIYRGAQLGRLPKPIVHRAWAPWRN